LCTGLTAAYISKDISLDQPQVIPRRSRPENWAEQIKVGVVGDSWVAGEKLDLAIEQSLLSYGLSADVISSGHPGAKSRQIYRNLLDRNRTTAYSSNSILMDEDLDFLVVIAGVNDTASHVGKDFYAHHMVCIVQASIARGITPVIVEVPEYGIELANATGLVSQLKQMLYRYLFDSGEVDVIARYRQALLERLDAASREQVIVVEFAPVATDYAIATDLYADPSHLNKFGFDKLGHTIAETIRSKHP
jgi:hypothetical protein